MNSLVLTTIASGAVAMAALGFPASAPGAPASLGSAQDALDTIVSDGYKASWSRWAPVDWISARRVRSARARPHIERSPPARKTIWLPDRLPNRLSDSELLRTPPALRRQPTSLAVPESRAVLTTTRADRFAGVTSRPGNGRPIGSVKSS